MATLTKKWDKWSQSFLKFWDVVKLSFTSVFNNVKETEPSIYGQSVFYKGNTEVGKKITFSRNSGFPTLKIKRILMPPNLIPYTKNQFQMIPPI